MKHHKVAVDNVIDALLFAEEKNCFLLKEAARDILLKNAEEVLASESFDNIPNSTSFVREIISLVATNNKQGDDTKKELDDPTKLSINELRAKLYDEGKDFDGPRNELISQLIELQKKRIKPSE